MDEPQLKYQELYQLSKEAVSNEIERIRRIEDKSSKMVTLCGVLIAFAALISKFGLSSFYPPYGLFDWVCLFSLVLFIALVIFTFLNLNEVLATFVLPINYVDQQMIEFFDKHTHIDVLYALARNNAKAIYYIGKQREKKLARLKRSHMGIKLSVSLIIVIIASQILSELTKHSGR